MTEFDMSDDEKKALMREVLRQWLDEQFALFGKWSLTGILSAAFIGAVYLALTSLHVK
jgi:hypothetical protein